MPFHPSSYSALPLTIPNLKNRFAIGQFAFRSNALLFAPQSGKKQ
jgi:hypothetical protein